MRSSVNIIQNGLKKKPRHHCRVSLDEIKTKRIMHNQMEPVIHHFKTKPDGFDLNIIDSVYAESEAPKGEFGIYFIPDEDGTLSRCRIRAPGFTHLQALGFMSMGHALADLVAIIGTQDIVFGEVDR